MIEVTNNNGRVRPALVAPSTQQSIDVVSEKIALLDKQRVKLTNNQVKEAVIAAVASLEDKAIEWSEILDVMSTVAFHRGKHQLGDLMVALSQQVWEAERHHD